MSSVGSYFPTVATGDRWSAHAYNMYVKGNMDVSGNGLVGGACELVIGAGYREAGVLAPGSDYDVLQADPNSSIGVSWTHNTIAAATQRLNAQIIPSDGVTKLDIGDVVYDPIGMVDKASGAIVIPLNWIQPRYFVLTIDLGLIPPAGMQNKLIQVGYAKGGVYTKWQSGTFSSDNHYQYLSAAFMDVADAAGEPGNKIELYMIHKYGSDITVMESRISLLLLR